MMHDISFFVPGNVVPQGGLRTFLVGGKPRTTHSNKTELEAWREMIAIYARKAIEEYNQTYKTEVWPYGRKVAYSVILEFVKDRPKSVPKRQKYLITRPDLDHYIRSTLDGLTSVVVPDDGQVFKIDSQKRYVNENIQGDYPGAMITVFAYP